MDRTTRPNGQRVWRETRRPHVTREQVIGLLRALARSGLVR